MVISPEVHHIWQLGKIDHRIQQQFSPGLFPSPIDVRIHDVETFDVFIKNFVQFPAHDQT